MSSTNPLERMPQDPLPRSHRTTLLDGGWLTPQFGFDPSGAPCIVINSVDGTETLVFPFNNSLHFAEFLRAVEEFNAARRRPTDE